jgi:hypothetical protein
LVAEIERSCNIEIDDWHFFNTDHLTLKLSSIECTLIALIIDASRTVWKGLQSEIWLGNCFPFLTVKLLAGDR